MALIDVVKCQVDDNELCYKFPSDDLRLGSQLVVYPSQTAFFVSGGKIYDEFEAGTFTIKTSNIPLLNKVLNLPFGGDSPFKAEVWFISQVAKLDIKWGTPQPIMIEDPLYNIIMPVRAFGQYGIRVSNPRLFLESLIGNMTSFTAAKVDQYFKGKIIVQLNSLISKKIALDKISILDISTMLMSLSEYCNEQLNTIFNKYGIEVLEFSLMSISVPQDDPSMIKLREAKDLAARLKITGRDVYQMERSFNVLDKAADNDGTAGQFMSMGTGLGAGLGVGSAMGQISSQVINTNPTATPPPIPQETTYFIYINGQQIGGQTQHNIAQFIAQGVVNGNTLVWKAGMQTWLKLSQIPELLPLLNTQTPPPVPTL